MSFYTLFVPLSVYLHMSSIRCIEEVSLCTQIYVETPTDHRMQLRVYCSQKRLTTIPHYLPGETAFLDLHGNNITFLPGTFSPFANITFLELSNNHLQLLNVNTFRGLKSLEIPNLTQNNLCLPTGYPRGVFKDLKSLRILKTFTIVKHSTTTFQMMCSKILCLWKNSH